MAYKIFRPAHQLPEPERPKSYRKHLILTLVLVIAVTIGILTFVIDDNIFTYLSAIQPQYLLGAFMASAIGIWLDAGRIIQMCRLTGDRLTYLQASKVLLGNYFFAFFTPGASGGPIAQFILLKRFGISAGKATLFVITRTLCSVTVMISLIPFLFYTEDTPPFDLPYYLPLFLSFFLLIGIFTAFWLARSPRFIRWSRGVAYMWSPQRFQRRILKLHKDLSGVAYLFSKNPFSMLFILLQTALSLSVSYSMVYFLFLGLQISISPIFLLGRMFLLNFLMHFAPTPGGSGIAEGLFLFLFSSQSTTGIAGIVAILWRIFSEYLPAIAGCVIMIHEFGYQYLKEKFWAPREDQQE